MKLRAALLCTVLWMPAPAQSDPVSAFFVAFAGGSATSAAVAASIGGLTGFAYTAGTFLGTTLLGSVLLNIGISALLAPKQKSPTIEDARINSRIANDPRRIMGGRAAVGGTAGIFSEFDEAGNFWYVIAHGDSEITDTPVYFLDSIKVEISDGTDGFTAGDVLTDTFCLNESGDQYEGTGTRDPVWRIYTVTPDKDNLFGEKPTEFTEAFPTLPSDFKGVGVCYSIIRGRAVRPERRQNAYRWRGPIGIGEPSVGIVANFDRMADPRDPAHDLNDPATWTAGNGNAAIVWAWFQMHPRGRGKSVSEINWDKVADEADLFDQTVANLNGDQVPLYRAGVAFSDDKPRHECEAEILAACDGFVAYDEEGKSFLVGGVYREPTIKFTAARDIFTAETQTVDDGEAPMDGVIVEYISPDHEYTRQPCTPWVNTLHYDGVSEPNYLKVPILACQDPNQATRLAKGIGLRLQPERRAGYGTNIKAVLAKSERGIILDHNTQFSGAFELVTPVEEDSSGELGRFAVVPLQQDRWTLNDGEEGPPPALTPVLNIDVGLELAQSVIVIAQPVITSNGAAVRVRASFDEPTRIDRFYRFRAVLNGLEQYLQTDMEEGVAISGIVDDGETYRVSWQTVTAGGRATVWSDERDTPEFVDVTATANPTAPSALLASNAVGGVGEATITWSTANDENQSSVRVYRGADFESAVLITDVLTPANTDSGTTQDVAAGSYSYWAAPVNGSGVQGPETGPMTVTVT